jgi:hypothetical protein
MSGHSVEDDLGLISNEMSWSVLRYCLRTFLQIQEPVQVATVSRIELVTFGMQCRIAEEFSKFLFRFIFFTFVDRSLAIIFI